MAFIPYDKCRVYGCTFPNKHITSFHTCSKCKSRGHGAYECGKYDLCEKLLEESKTDSISLLKKCNLKSCLGSRDHTIESHSCSICGHRHPEYYCFSIKKNEDRKKYINLELLYDPYCIFPDEFKSIFNPSGDLIKKINDIFDENIGKSIYIIIPWEMGNCFYLRKKYDEDEYLVMLVSADNCGQYPELLNDLEIAKLFTYKYEEVKI